MFFKLARIVTDAFGIITSAKVIESTTQLSLKNEAITILLPLSSAYLQHGHLRPAGSHWRRLSHRHRVRATRQTRPRKRISAEPLLHGERLAHGRLRFRMGGL